MLTSIVVSLLVSTAYAQSSNIQYMKNSAYITSTYNLREQVTSYILADNWDAVKRLENANLIYWLEKGSKVRIIKIIDIYSLRWLVSDAKTGNMGWVYKSDLTEKPVN